MTVGVLVMAHGTPASREEVLPFYTRIRRGRPPTDEQLADLLRRYDAIGGLSPLAQRTAAQVAGIAAALEAEAPGRFVVRFGAKHAEPSIEEAASALAAQGHARVVGLVLAPHRASLGSEEYLARAEAALGGAAPFTPISAWYRAPGFAELVGGRLSASLRRVRGRPATVVFTAHSLPERAVAATDPYPEQVRQSAELVMAAARPGGGVTARVAWQSAGRTPEPWLGPDLLGMLRALPADGTRAVVVCPIGFVADHLEVLYDVDIEARAAAESVRLEFDRTESLNDDPALVRILATVVTGAAGG